MTVELLTSSITDPAQLKKQEFCRLSANAHDIALQHEEIFISPTGISEMDILNAESGPKVTAKAR